MNKICTDIKQSKKLIELGIDTNTSDMVWQSIEDDESFDGTWEVIPKCNSLNVGYKDDVPAWSLSALFGLISPGNILLRDALNGKYKCINMVDSSYYDNPLDAAFEMVCWLKENKKL